MTSITITIEESSDQVISGIPRSILLSTNIPCTIFYSLDGKDPDFDSDIFINSIKMPTSKPSVTIKIFATNGQITSQIISETYTTNILHNTRLPHSAVDGEANRAIEDLYPFGTNPDPSNGHFLNPSNRGVTVNNPELDQLSNGFDSDGYDSLITNEVLNTENYSLIFSTTDSQGNMGPGIGTLPGKITITPEKKVPEQTDQFSKLFDPRAMVIFQDVSKENPNDPPVINRQFFTLENHTDRSGALLYNVGLETPSVSGSFIKSFYNPRDNTVTYYYRDSRTDKWIISKAPYISNGGFDGNLANVIMPNRNSASRFVFSWNPFRGRVLF